MNSLKPRPPFQVLVMMEQARLGRSLDEVPYAIRKITEAGVRIYFYLTDTEVRRENLVDRFQSSVMAFVDEMHREQSRQRTRDALRRQAERGHVAGGLVYGYRNREVRVGERRSHVVREIDADQTEVVRRIFREIAKGSGFLRIARELNAAGVPSPRPGGRHGWATSGVREIVMRDLYRGVVVYGRTRWEDRDGTKHKVDTPPSEWITVEVPELRIVDADLWAQAHARLSETRKLYARLTDGKLIGRPGATLESRYLLTGFLRCGKCGGSVYVTKQPSRGRMLLYYICAARRIGSSCPGGGVRIAVDKLDAAVLADIEAKVLSPDRLELILARVAARQQGKATSPEERRARMERQLREAKARVERYVRAIGEGLDLAEVRGQLNDAKAAAVALEAQLAALNGHRAPLDMERLRKRVADWRGVLHRGPAMARSILRKLIPGKLDLFPAPEGGVAFRGAAAVAGLLAGTAYVMSVVPPG